MNIESSKEYIENSFLKDLLIKDSVTDISFNGEDIFYQDNLLGRKHYDKKIPYDVIENFIKQVSYLSEKTFSYSTPILDITIDRYRITALYSSISKRHYKSVVTFSIRIGSKELRIKENSDFINPTLYEFFLYCLKERKSIVIGGVTGTGKTEFQKFLLSNSMPNERIIVIDNISELDGDFYKEGNDINIWVFNENSKNITLSDLIKTALRSNPDWLILAEAREKEMKDILISSQTGHPIITCLHASSLKSIVSRIVRMIMMSENISSYQIIEKDVLNNFDVFVILDKRSNDDHSIKRYIKEIGISFKEKIKVIFKNDGEDHYYKIPSSFFSPFNFSIDFKKNFLGEDG